MKGIVYVVTSRENGPVFATMDPELAETKRAEQYEDEEHAGGRPSVYIKELELN